MKYTRILSIALLAGGLGMAAQAQASDAVVGAIVGAGAGALVGQAFGGRDGAVIGGAIGAAAGANMARQPMRGSTYGHVRFGGGYHQPYYSPVPVYRYYHSRPPVRGYYPPAARTAIIVHERPARYYRAAPHGPRGAARHHPQQRRYYRR